MKENNTFIANGSVNLKKIKPNQHENRAGFHTLFAKDGGGAGFGGGTISIEVTPDEGASWFALIDVELTADGTVNFQSNGDTYRVTLSGATSPDLDWWVI